MIIDAYLPHYETVITEHIVVNADPNTTWRTARDLDLMRVHTPLMDATMWIRGLPARLRGQPKPALERLSLHNGDPLPGWLILGEQEGQETAFGAIGKFWQGTIEWRDVPLTHFAQFAEPGYGKIACNFSMRPYNPHQTLLSYECRVATTDEQARRKFARYWWLIRPFVGHIMRATLATIRTEAQHAASVDAAQPPGARR